MLFYYPSKPAPTGCGADNCVADRAGCRHPGAVVGLRAGGALGRLDRAVTRRDWRGWAVLVAFLAGWVTWFSVPGRTMFLFYMTPLVPFLVSA